AGCLSCIHDIGVLTNSLAHLRCGDKHQAINAFQSCGQGSFVIESRDCNAYTALCQRLSLFFIAHNSNNVGCGNITFQKLIGDQSAEVDSCISNCNTYIFQSPNCKVSLGTAIKIALSESKCYTLFRSF